MTDEQARANLNFLRQIIDNLIKEKEKVALSKERAIVLANVANWNATHATLIQLGHTRYDGCKRDAKRYEENIAKVGELARAEAA